MSIFSSEMIAGKSADHTCGRMTNDQLNPNDQCSMSKLNSDPVVIGILGLDIGHSLGIGHWALVIISSGLAAVILKLARLKSFRPAAYSFTLSKTINPNKSGR